MGSLNSILDDIDKMRDDAHKELTVREHVVDDGDGEEGEPTEKAAAKLVKAGNALIRLAAMANKGSEVVSTDGLEAEKVTTGDGDVRTITVEDKSIQKLRNLIYNAAYPPQEADKNDLLNVSRFLEQSIKDARDWDVQNNERIDPEIVFNR